MAVTIVAKTPKIITGKKPKGSKPEWLVHDVTKDQAIVFNRLPIDGFTAIGKATLKADKAGEAIGYTLGWIQMQLMETRWAIYRGKEDADGSLFGNYGWNANFPICRDVGSDPKAILYDATYDNEDKSVKHENRFTVPSGTGTKINMVCEFRDFPTAQFPLFIDNSTTKKVNYIHEVLVEYYFCMVLTLQKPDKTFEHLKHVYWSIGWHCKFTPPDKNGIPGINPVSGYKHPGKACKVLEKGPADVRVTNKLTAAEVFVCNARAKDRQAAVEVQGTMNYVFNTQRATRSQDDSTESYDCFKK